MGMLSDADDRVRDWLGNLADDVPVVAGLPQDAAPGDGGEPALAVHLLGLEPAHRLAGEAHRPAPVVARACYLVTARAGDERAALELLDRVLTAALDAGPPPDIDLDLAPLPLEAWQALRARPRAALTVRVTARHAPPVPEIGLVREPLRVVGPGLRPCGAGCSATATCRCRASRSSWPGPGPRPARRPRATSPSLRSPRGPIPSDSPSGRRDAPSPPMSNPAATSPSSSTATPWRPDHALLRTPGIYVEEVPSGARPIGAVGTSTAGFVGAAPDRRRPPRRGRRGQHLVGVRAALRRRRRPRHRRSPTAVYGFFENGGGRCYVVNIAEGAADRRRGPRSAPGLRALEAIDEVAIVAAPGYADPTRTRRCSPTARSSRTAWRSSTRRPTSTTSSSSRGSPRGPAPAADARHGHRLGPGPARGSGAGRGVDAGAEAAGRRDADPRRRSRGLRRPQSDYGAVLLPAASWAATRSPASW